jgi:hypothetical protein
MEAPFESNASYQLALSQRQTYQLLRGPVRLVEARMSQTPPTPGNCVHGAPIKREKSRTVVVGFPHHVED